MMIKSQSVKVFVFLVCYISCKLTKKDLQHKQKVQSHVAFNFSCKYVSLPATFSYYTIRYRERNRKWIYQTCPTSDTVIDNLKPNTPYEFGVRSNKDDRRGTWSKPVIHNTNMGGEELNDSFHSTIPDSSYFF